MRDILSDIIRSKKEEVEQAKALVSPEALRQEAEAYVRLHPQTRSMRRCLESSATGIIAEFKRRSPSKGWLHPEADPALVAPAYEQAGASALSILTDTPFFGGTLDDLRAARRLVDLPILRKDFVIDPYQLLQARLAGADAVLLIAACLSPGQCRALAAEAHALGLEVLLEVHAEDELACLTPDIDMLGVNNRHLGTFHTDVQNSLRLAESLRRAASRVGEPLLVSESGISSPATIAGLRQAGFRGFLIGEAFMKTARPGETLHAFIQDIQTQSQP